MGIECAGFATDTCLPQEPPGSVICANMSERERLGRSL